MHWILSCVDRLLRAIAAGLVMAHLCWAAAPHAHRFIAGGRRWPRPRLSELETWWAVGAAIDLWMLFAALCMGLWGLCLPRAGRAWRWTLVASLVAAVAVQQARVRLPLGATKVAVLKAAAQRWPTRTQLSRLLPAGDLPRRSRKPVPTDVDLSGVVLHWPVAGDHRISSGFGSRHNPVTGRWHRHRGVDIPMAIGTPIASASAGRVERAAEDGLNGNHVVVKGGRVRAAYCHMDSLAVETGQEIEAGVLLGRSGNTGRSTGPHLHFGIWVDGVPIDPLLFR